MSRKRFAPVAALGAERSSRPRNERPRFAPTRRVTSQRAISIEPNVSSCAMITRSALHVCAGALLCLAGFTTESAAQSFTGVAAADSASAARAAWQRAVVAFNAKDVATARKEVDRAANAWPAQPAYVWARAVTAQLAADTDGVRNALESYAALGLGRDLRTDARFAGYVPLPRFAAIVARH